MMRIQLLTTLAALLLSTATLNAADLTLPVNISAGSARTSLVIGIVQGAGNGYDKGLDVPPAEIGEALSALIPHPEWDVTSPDGKRITALYRDMRGSLPQRFTVQIAATSAPVTLAWDRTKLPATINAVMTMPDSSSIDMKKQAATTLQVTSANVTITLDEGDTLPPAVPRELGFELKGAGFYFTWAANTEPDLAGYKLHWSQDNGFARSVDLKAATNYNLMNILDNVPYQIAVSAYDSNGNESAVSSTLKAVKTTAPPPVPKPNGDFNGDGKVDKADVTALSKAISKRGYKPSVSELSRADMNGDGKLTKLDLAIIQKLISSK